MKRVLGWLAFTLIGCGSGQSAPRTAEPTTEEPALVASDDKPAAEPGRDAGVEPTATDLEAPAPGPAGPVRFDVDDWANERQIEITLVSDGCELAELGDKPNDVIWCNHHVESAHMTTFSRTLYAARGKRLVKLIEIPIASAPLAESVKYNLKLEIERTDATHVEVKEAPGLDCERVKKENEDIGITKPDEYKERVSAAKKVCAARGRYEWVGGTLRKGR